MPTLLFHLVTAINANFMCCYLQDLLCVLGLSVRTFLSQTQKRKGKAVLPGEAKNSPQYQLESVNLSASSQRASCFTSNSWQPSLLQNDPLITGHVRKFKTVQSRANTDCWEKRISLDAYVQVWNYFIYVRQTFAHRTAAIFVVTPSTLVGGCLRADVRAFGAMALWKLESAMFGCICVAASFSYLCL